jgi:hypothetical protein
MRLPVWQQGSGRSKSDAKEKQRKEGPYALAHLRTHGTREHSLLVRLMCCLVSWTQAHAGGHYSYG